MTKNLNKFREWGVLAVTRRISTTPRLPLGRPESQSAFGQEIHVSTLADKGGSISPNAVWRQLLISEANYFL